MLKELKIRFKHDTNTTIPGRAPSKGERHPCMNEGSEGSWDKRSTEKEKFQVQEQDLSSDSQKRKHLTKVEIFRVFVTA